NRDGEARRALAPMTVAEAPRSCAPLDSPDCIAQWSPSHVLSRPAGEGPAAHERGGSFASLRIGLPIRERLIFLSGKGGVGKTTCAASIALQLANENRDQRFTVISVDPAHSLRDVFAREKPP